MSDTIIPIRCNLHLWLLTGRCNDFFNGTLNTGVRYEVRDTPDEVLEARRILRLDNTLSDFFVTNAMAAVCMSPPMLRTLPADNSSMFEPRVLRLPAASSSHEMLAPDSLSWPSVDGAAAGMEGFTAVAFQKSGAEVLLTTDAGYSGTTGWSSVSESEGLRLVFDRAEEFGIRAHFRAATWDDDDFVRVTMAPTRYPFEKFADEAASSSPVLRLMTAESTMGVFSSTPSHALRVGMVALAVMRRMLRHAKSEQAGFRITSDDWVTSDDAARSYEFEPILTDIVETAATDPDNPGGFDA